MLTRRNLLEGACATLALAAVGGVGVAFAGESAPLRPPGTGDEDHLLGTCIRCDRCRSVCPRDAIGVATVEDGLINARTPKMEFRKGYCDECGGDRLCATVCPVGSIRPFEEGYERIGVAVIDPQVCLTYGISGSCPANCIDACPVDALSIDDNGRLAIDAEPCWGCGACEYHCISDSYGVYEGTGNRGINVVKSA